VTLSGNSFTGNSPAGASCYGTTIAISGNTFIGNGGGSGGGSGGAVCWGSGVTNIITCTSNVFTSNSAGDWGGGVYCQGFGTTTLLGNTFTGNNSGYAGGGAACAPYTDGTVTLSGNVFSGNSASLYGGGVYCSVGGSGTISGTVTLSGNTFTGNYAESGGGSYCIGVTVTLSANRFNQNSAAVGGGIFASGQTITLLDDLVVKNTVSGTSSQGGGIYVDANSTVSMINNTVFGNTSAGSGGGVAYVGGLLNVYNNIIWGNFATASGGDVWLNGSGNQNVFDFNDVDSMYGVWYIAQNNIDLSPQFFDPVNGDYHIQSTSPCIGAGTTNAPMLPATDLDGNSRVMKGKVDLGCYEFTTAVTHPADTNGVFVITATEFNAYAAAWKNGQAWTIGPNPGPNPIPANYMTRAGYLMTNGGAYYNDGSARPTNWKIKITP
jgi:hypothetical protein